MRGCDLARDDGRIVGAIDPQSHVDAVFRNLQAGIGERKLNLQPGLPRSEFRQQRGNPASTKFHRRSNLQESTGRRTPRRHLCFRVARAREDAPAMAPGFNPNALDLNLLRVLDAILTG
jgi:hypothetical protein